MSNNQPREYKDFSTTKAEKETFYQRRINEQDEDHIDDDFIDRAPADYSRYQTESKPDYDLSDYGYENQAQEFINEQEFGSDRQVEQRQDQDQERDIPHGLNSGRYPRSLRKNSDDLLKEKVSECLSRDRDIDASDIEVVVRKGTVFLNGTVLNRDERFKAEMAIENINGIEDIQNDLKLRKVGYKH